MNGGQSCLGPSQQKMDCNTACPGESLESIIYDAMRKSLSLSLSLRSILFSRGSSFQLAPS